jgi:hypothetical protein
MNKHEEAKISLDHQSIKLDEFGRFEMAEIVDPALLEEVSGGMRREQFYNIIGCSGRSWYWV